jgi:hypothetical protein
VSAHRLARLTSWLPCVVLLPLLLACGDREPRQDTAPASAAEATGAPASELRDAAAVRDYRLDIDAVRRYYSVNEGMVRLASEDAGFRARMEAAGQEADTEEDLASFARRLEQIPEFRRELQRAGLTPHDYALITAALAANVLYVIMDEMGGGVERSDWVSDANIAFVREHRAELDALTERIEALQPDEDW